MSVPPWVGLEHLPQLTVESVVVGPAEVVMEGRFNHLRSVRLGVCWLYQPRHMSVPLDLVSCSASGHATLKTSALNWVDDVVPGQSFPCFSRYWQPQLVEAVLEGPAAWSRLRFPAEDYKAPCEICFALIGPHFQAHGFMHAGDWICERCFERYVSREGLAFIVEGTHAP